MIVGSLAGPLCAGGGFCAGSLDIIEHQRISAAAYTFSAALPAMLATTASETLNMLQTNPEVLVQCRDNIKAMRAQLDPRSDWVVCTSVVENPVMLLVLKPDVIASRRLSIEEQERVLQECVDEVSYFFSSFDSLECLYSSFPPSPYSPLPSTNPNPTIHK
jgi:7-keto-8-aminopelargonate synthetase-like enzyme